MVMSMGTDPLHSKVLPSLSLIDSIAYRRQLHLNALGGEPSPPTVISPVLERGDRVRLVGEGAVDFHLNNENGEGERCYGGWGLSS